MESTPTPEDCLRRQAAAGRGLGWKARGVAGLGGAGRGQGAQLRRSGDRSLRPQADRSFEKVVPEGAGLGHQVHLCPHLASGRKEAVPQGTPGVVLVLLQTQTPLILTSFSVGKVARRPPRLCLWALRKESVLAAAGPTGHHFDPGLGGPQGLAELWPQTALPGGLRGRIAWQGQAGLCAQRLSQP